MSVLPNPLLDDDGIPNCKKYLLTGFIMSIDQDSTTKSQTNLAPQSVLNKYRADEVGDFDC